MNCHLLLEALLESPLPEEEELLKERDRFRVAIAVSMDAECACTRIFARDNFRVTITYSHSTVLVNIERSARIFATDNFWASIL